jgi:hypothetical protein
LEATGLIGWVPNCDTLHALIKDYRESRKVPLNVEHRLMLGMAPDYDFLCVIQKVEVFEHALDSTSGLCASSCPAKLQHRLIVTGQAAFVCPPCDCQGIWRSLANCFKRRFSPPWALDLGPIP